MWMYPDNNGANPRGGHAEEDSRNGNIIQREAKDTGMVLVFARRKMPNADWIAEVGQARGRAGRTGQTHAGYAARKIGCEI